MNIELKTLSLKTLITTIAIGFPLIIGISAVSSIYTENMNLFLLFIPALGLCFYLGFRLSKKTTKIDLRNSESIKINDQIIAHNDIIGYYIDDRGGSQKGFYLKLSNEKTIMIGGSKLGEEGEIFDSTINKIIAVIEQNNQDFHVLQYNDIYKEYTFFSKPAFRIGLAIILFVLALLKVITLFT
ncbi:hypothetical protein SAMN04489761_3607 [Tenacibaculum sp. MAR_2009_124]|uniref:hypothetical protein n=1 Tax=Tenacibaculum sp. MAR_2009_124 TaxID=1250059 RepID=UPI00089B8860|nr:hypothetical protein [Tenacibaculum sp. MAR_2009_124]SEC79551.1 hypothetical protein SAMN04489761_3607 [Tenacibaculum sp. MAR_2009_124]